MKSLKDILSRFLLPLLLGVAIMSSIIYDYRTTSVVPLTVLSAAEGLVSFVLLDILYKRKHKFLSGCVYLLLLFAAVFVSFNMVFSGYNTSGVSFNTWFYSVTDYVPLYLYALVFGGGFLFYSALYYFTQVRYRGLFTLLLVIFPFAIYAKRLDTMLDGYLAAILLLYLLVMVHNRQTAADSGIVVVPNKAYIVSILAFTAAVVGVLFIVPKPEIESVQERDASVFERFGLFSQQEVVETLNEFQDSSARHHGEFPTGQELFVVNTTQDGYVYLKNQSYSYFADNNWHYGTDKYEEADYVWSEPETTVPGLLPDRKLELLYTYAKYNEDKETMKLIDDYRQSSENKFLTVYPVADIRFSYLPLPENTLRVFMGYGGEIFPDNVQNGNVYCNGEWQMRNDTYQYKAEYADNDKVRELAEKLDMTSADWDYIMNWYLERRNDEGFSRQLYSDVNSDKSFSDEIDSGEYDEYDDSIRQLAQQITQGCDSDYEKAAALESYFEQAGFTYDMTYVPDDESIEYFIFESKTGICSDFATAMTLMARSVGLKARYCEGYIASNPVTSEQLRGRLPYLTYNPDVPFGESWYMVTDSNAHAFVEVYLPAVGWVVFEPTVPGFEEIMNAPPEENGNAFSFLTQYGFYIRVGMVLAAAIILLVLYRPVSEGAFRLYVRKCDAAKAICLMYKRTVKRFAKKTDTDLSAYTVMQVCTFAQEYGIDIDVLANVFEETFYGKLTPEETKRSAAYEQYKTARKAKLKKAAIDSGQ